MKAMILAAGDGTRLRPLTSETPKVLLNVAGVPLISYILAWLKSHGIVEVAINIHHSGEKVKEFLEDGSSSGVKISYSFEEILLGTSGGVKRMESFFDETLVVIYGDILTDFDLGGMVKFHKLKGALVTIAVQEVPNPWDVGIVKMNEEGKILSFVEKPARGLKVGNLGSGGVYVLEKQALDYVPNDGFSDFAYDIFPKLIQLGFPMYGYTLKYTDYLIDIGTIDRYRKADQDARESRIRLHSRQKMVMPLA